MTLRANRKLTGVIRGRTLTGVTRAGDVATVEFGDGSRMTVKLADGAPAIAVPPARPVTRARQDDTTPTLAIDLADGATLTLPLAEATSSVLLRAADATFEYAD